MSEWIEISGTLRTDPAKVMTSDQMYPLVQQIAEDAVYGSFGGFPLYWEDKWEKDRGNLVDPETEVVQRDEDEFRFTLRISDTLFPIYPAGIQHLMGVLAGDLFYTKTPDGSVQSITVDRVELPESLREDAYKQFRKDRAHTINSIRSSFGLGDNDPLLAFSFKPRVGIRFEEVEKITLGVLAAGFHIVELDTRHLRLGDKDIEKMIGLARKAVELRTSHCTRFSPNLTVPAPHITRCTDGFREVHPEDGPLVIKIDGGLDGISACQALRQYDKEQAIPQKQSPVITCYPLLRNQLNSRVPSAFFIEALALSGVDIIYPGGRPSIGVASRTIGDVGQGRLISAVQKYRQLVHREWPLPTVAGGVYAGELHAFYELLGPRVAFFLGGAVALHKDGPIEGAKLCVAIIEEAAKLRKRDPTEAYINDLSSSLRLKCENAYTLPLKSTNSQFAYISPATLLQATSGLRSWFEINKQVTTNQK